MALTTTYGDTIPNEVASMDFRVNVIVGIPQGQSAQSLLEKFVAEMFPSRGTPTLGSRFGGIHSGRYYEALVNQTNVNVWANNAETAREIAVHFKSLQSL
ncbi:MAG TPA: hypothetical protein VJI97_04815 [Candidatus Nanoarchaeia archaeon]|nr:hypothetical protein [Candidatus Nanoarchaeia archaeon]